MRVALRLWGFGLAALVAGSVAAAQKTRPAKSPHVEITARAEVATAPRRTVHKNGRKFLEFEVILAAYVLAPDQPADADRKVPIDMQGKVKIVHDLSCGAEDLALAVGDQVELLGEYVEIPKGPDLIHFTHGTDARSGCGAGGSHPGGYLRKVNAVPSAPPTPKVTAPRPADIVPDQPWFGAPVAGEKPYAAILRMKETGASDEALLEAIRSSRKTYSLSTYDIQELRASGISARVMEAMLQSGRSPQTPAPSPAPTPPR